MKSTLACVEVALDAGTLLLVADVAFHLKSLIVQSATVLVQPKESIKKL